MKKRRPPERRRRPEPEQAGPSQPRAPSAERVLIEYFPVRPEGRVLCTSMGRGQLAAAIAADAPDAQVACWFLDAYAADETRDWYSLDAELPQPPDVLCEADFPDQELDLVAIPISHRGEAELVRELLQQACLRLKPGGVVVAGVDNPNDRWLHGELKTLFSRIRRDPRHHGVVYSGVRMDPPKRIRNFRSDFAFRDQGRLVQAVSRPGVFSHRELDLGARALLEACDVAPGERVLDIGCGSGTVGLALSLRQPDVVLHGIDSNIRAVECLQAGAALNKLVEATVEHTAEGRIAQPGTFDLAVGNPPYFSQYRIAEIFVQAARTALKPGGRVAMVTKKPEWFEARLGQLFDGVETQTRRSYSIVSARQRGG
ncbi:MAG: methyltransferase [Planctomyces sp.]|nr:methyltransferase [Planctomyces sp.]